MLPLHADWICIADRRSVIKLLRDKYDRTFLWIMLADLPKTSLLRASNSAIWPALRNTLVLPICKGKWNVMVAQKPSQKITASPHENACTISKEALLLEQPLKGVKIHSSWGRAHNSKKEECCEKRVSHLSNNYLIAREPNLLKEPLASSDFIRTNIKYMMKKSGSSMLGKNILWKRNNHIPPIQNFRCEKAKSIYKFIKCLSSRKSSTTNSNCLHDSLRWDTQSVLDCKHSGNSNYNNKKFTDRE